MQTEDLLKIYRKLRRIERSIKAASELSFSMTKAVRYTGLSKSHLYKLTSSRNIPHYKPYGKMIYFKKSELDRFLLKNKISTQEEIELATRKALFKLNR